MCAVLNRGWENCCCAGMYL